MFWLGYYRYMIFFHIACHFVVCMEEHDQKHRMNPQNRPNTNNVNIS